MQDYEPGANGSAHGLTTPADPLDRHWAGVPGGQEPVTVKIDSLRLDGSPRLEGEDERHVRVLAETAATLPPVLVHRATMRVIDGVHRVKATKLRGEEAIRAIFFDGDAMAAFVHAVEANVSHGLPLSLADRRTAANRILAFYPQWSDRAIAAVAGLSATTVQSLRERATAGSQPSGRVGKDGKIRPVDPGAGRRRAASLIQERPNASLRQVASLAGVSIGTARDVRRRLREGEDPVPHGASRGSRSRLAHEPAGGHAEPRRPDRGRPQQLRLVHDQVRNPRSILDNLKRDPSLRYSELGRSIVRWLDAHVVDNGDRSKVSQSVPPHCSYAIAELALGCAKAWEELARELMANAETGQVAP